MSNNIPVNGWPQLKDLEAVQPTLDRLDKIEAWKKTVKEETFTGEEITIPNALALPARSLITEINAIQDLHGLPFPYVGGANGNLFGFDETFIKTKYEQYDLTNHTLSLSGVLFTLNVDNGGNITGVGAVGTPDANLVFFVGKFIAKANVTYRIMLRTNSPNSETFARASGPQDQFTYNYGAVNTTGTTFSVPSDTELWLNVRLKINTAVDYLFEPLIFLESESDKSYRPYSNICPISGRDSVVLTRSDGDEISEDFTIQLGTTVYGAEINWDTGVMTVTHTITTLTGAESETWDMSSGDGWHQFYLNILDSLSSADSISNRFEQIQLSDRGTKTGLIQYTDRTFRFALVDSQLNITSVADWKTWLASNNVQVCYKLETPQTIQLTPTQLEMLKGYNHITLSDGYGTIELKALTGANWS